MGQKPLTIPLKTQMKFVFYVNSPFHHHPKFFFKDFLLKFIIRFEIIEKLHHDKVLYLILIQLLV